MSRPLYLLDTNSCIYLLARSKPRLSERVQDAAPGTIAISAIVGAELALCFSRAGAGGDAKLVRFLRTFPLLPFDEEAARAYARVPFKRGKFDRLIAAHSVALDLPLVTSNVSAFKDVPGLKLEDWSQP